MSHSVEKHLAVSAVEYDAGIRRFVPAYDTMLDEVVGALVEHLPAGSPRVVDLGAGTGSLSERIASRLPEVRLTLVDADAEMLARAATRLEAKRDRVELRHGSFADPIGACDAVVATLSLHHLHERDAKLAVYRNIHAALPTGGVLVNADATIPASPALAKLVRRRWAAHLVANGDTEAEAFARFAQWDGEDRYFGIDEELAMLAEAGFTEVDVRWRVAPCSVIVGRRG